MHIDKNKCDEVPSGQIHFLLNGAVICTCTAVRFSPRCFVNAPAIQQEPMTHMDVTSVQLC